jgi:hypothetical protein
MPAKRRYYRVYEKVELRIYKNDFKSTNPQIEVLVDLLFYKATKIIIDSVSYKYSKISKEMVKPR